MRTKGARGVRWVSMVTDVISRSYLLSGLIALAGCAGYFREGKVMLWAGSYHLPTHRDYPDGGNFLREGSYASWRSFVALETKGSSPKVPATSSMRTLTIAMSPLWFGNTVENTGA